MKNLIWAWDSFWFQRISPYPIAAFRVTFGLYMLIYFLTFLPNIELFFSNQGVYAPFAASYNLPWPISDGLVYLSNAPNWAPSVQVAWFLYLCTLVLMLAFIVGYRTKLVTPLLFNFYLYHFFLSLAVKNCSYDRLIIIFFCMLCFGELDRVWSVGPKNPNNTVSAWLTRLICLQVTLFYFGTGFYKLLTPYWHHGEILTMTLTSNWGTSAAFWLVNLGLPMWVFDLMTWSLVAFELSCGFLFYIRKIQKWVFVLGLIFHLSVWIFLNIPEFILCPITYVIFMPPEELKSIGDWISKRLGMLKLKLLQEQIANT
jgi:hypothetical protein